MTGCGKGLAGSSARIMSSVSLLAGLALSGSAVTSPLHAQTNTTPDTEDSANPVCMSGPWRDARQTMAPKKGKRFKIVVAQRDSAGFVKRGFSKKDCAAADLVSVARRNAWRDEICTMASFGNEAVQQQLARALGARPAELCASAELTVGPWKGNIPPGQQRILDEVDE